LVVCLSVCLSVYGIVQ